MSTLVLIEIVIKSGLVAAACLLLVLGLKRLPAAQRAWIAHAGLLLTLLMPLLVLFGPTLELTGPWSRLVDSAPVGVTPAMTAATSSAADTPMPAVNFQLTPWLLVLGGWGVIAAALIATLVIGLARLLRLQQEASVLTDRDWLAALAHAQHRMGVKQGTALLTNDRLGSPISWGLLRPTIVLSRAALQTPDRAEAILAHELAHVVRMDWANMLIARVATALFWFNPLVWLLAWQAHELREEAADDVVLRGDVRGTDYATLLVGFARDDQRAGALVAHGVAPGRRSLKRRLLRVLDSDVRRDPAHPAWRTGWAAAAALLAAPLAAFTPVDRFMEAPVRATVGSSRVDLQACKLEYSIVSPK